MATMAVVILGFLLVALVVILFLKLRLARDREQIAIMKAIGFTDDDIKKQYQTKMLLAAFPGIIIGIVLANRLGSVVVSAALSLMGLGISRITCKKHFFPDLRII